MRRSTPGIRNVKSDRQSRVNLDKKQLPHIPPYDPDWDMQYGCSRKTGCKVGGCYWNPPSFCEKRILTYGDERWVSACLCHECHRYKSKTCPASDLKKIVVVDGHPVYDEPSTRKPRRVERPSTRRFGPDASNESDRPRGRRRS